METSLLSRSIPIGTKEQTAAHRRDALCSSTKIQKQAAFSIISNTPFGIPVNPVILSKNPVSSLSNRPVFDLFEDGDEFVDLGAFEDSLDSLVVDVGVGGFVEAGRFHHAVGGEVVHDFL